MKRDVLGAYAMLAVECAAFIWYSQDVVFAALILILGALGAFAGLRSQWMSRWVGLVCTLLFVIFVVYALWGPTASRPGVALFSYRTTHPAAQFWLSIQCVYLFARWERVPLLYLLAGMLALIFLGDVRLLGWQAFPYQLATLTVLALAVLLGTRHNAGVLPGTRPATTRRHSIVMAVLLAGVVVGSLSGSVLYAYQREIELLLVDWAPQATRQATTGFTEQSRLNSVQRLRRTGDNDVMLRVYGPGDQIYFTGRAFERYAHEEWVANPSILEADTVPAPDWMDTSEVFDSFKVVRLSGELGPEPGKFIVWPDWSLEDAFFRPLGTTLVRTMGWNLELDRNDTGNFVRSFPGEPYLIFGGSNAAPPQSKETLLEVPEDLNPKVKELADTIIAGASTPEEKLERIENFFATKYEYASNIEVPRRWEPVTYFLLSERPASCEFFATGTVLLLRLAGVPCRYVTGFVVAENQEYGGYRLARNRDAHAWVEAYIEDHWVTVDTTPANGRPDHREATYLAYALDTFRQLRREVGTLLQSRGIQDAWIWLQQRGTLVVQLLLSMWPLWLLAGAILFGVMVTIRGFREWRLRRLLAAARRGAQHPLSPLLAEADRRVMGTGLIRDRTETLHGFARRLAGLPSPSATKWADWYLAVAEARYALEPASADAVQAVTALKRSLPAAGRGIPPRWRRPRTTKSRLKE